MGMTEQDAKTIMEDMEDVQPISMYEYIETLVNSHPNDADLGKSVRELMHILRTGG